MIEYKVSLTTKLKPPQKGMIVIEPEDYKAAEVAALKQHAKVLAYLSIGSISDERSCDKEMMPYALRKLEDWPHERYLDLTQPAVRDWLQKRARDLKRTGFDGLWLDNVDIYEEYRTTEMFNAIVNTLMAIKAIRGYVMINGGSLFLTDLMIPHKVQLGAYKNEKNAKKMAAALKKKGFNATTIEMDNLQKVQVGAFSSQENADNLVEKLHAAGFGSAKRITLHAGKPAACIDGATQEEVYSLIANYKGKGKFTKQTREESERYQAHMRRIVKNGLQGFLLEYVDKDDNTLRLRIKTFCEVAGMTGCCISADKDL